MVRPAFPGSYLDVREAAHAAFEFISEDHGWEWGWIDDMGDEDDRDAYTRLWRCTATGSQPSACSGCALWDRMRAALGIEVPKPWETPEMKTAADESRKVMQAAARRYLAGKGRSPS